MSESPVVVFARRRHTTAARPSPKLAALELTDDERRTLTAWARRRKTSQTLAVRSQIVLACAEGGTIGSVAAELGVSRDMVSKWRGRFVRYRLEGLNDRPRPGRPRTITDEQVEQVITATLEQAPPEGAARWSTRSMARSAGMSHTAISRIWRASGLKPHQVESWKPSTDPVSVDKGHRRDPGHPHRSLPFDQRLRTLNAAGIGRGRRASITPVV